MKDSDNDYFHEKQLHTRDQIIEAMSKDMKALADKMKWISVEDALPKEKESWCLVYANGAINCMMFHKEKFTDATYANCHNIFINQITHWMPLPEPPATSVTVDFDTEPFDKNKYVAPTDVFTATKTGLHKL